MASEPYQISKMDTDRSMVFGFANVSVLKSGQPMVDLDGDVIPVDVLEDAAYDFVLKARACGEMHEGDDVVGDMVESVMITPEKLESWGLAKDAIQPRWWIGFKLSPTAMAKVKSGEYRMFSIQGRSLVQKVE
jgi:hypothetical protein